MSPASPPYVDQSIFLSLESFKSEIRSDIKELKDEMKELKKEQLNTRDTFQRGKGALYILSVIGGITTILTLFGHAVWQAISTGLPH
jgi:hypothetical protein